MSQRLTAGWIQGFLFACEYLVGDEFSFFRRPFQVGEPAAHTAPAFVPGEANRSWCARWESNPQPTAPEAVTLSS